MAEAAEKRVTWAELFFDLVFVFAVTQVSGLLHDDHTWSGVGRALIVFVPVWWAWVGTTVHANRHDVDNPRDILGIFTLGLGSLGMALAVGFVHGNARAVLWGLAALTDLVTPRLLRSRLAVVRFDTGHLPERFGLFLIIALGESVVQIGVAASGGALTGTRLVATIAAYALACSLWWVYFVFAASAVRHALAEARIHADVVRPVF